MSDRYSTEVVEPPERFDYWREVICDAYLPIRCETPDSKLFNGEIELHRLSHLNISRVQGSQQLVSRLPADIARNTETYFLLSLQVSNSSQVTQSERCAALLPNDFTLYSTSEPYDIVCQNNVDQLVIQLPYQQLISRIPNAEMLTGLRVDGQQGLGGMVSRQIRECTEAIGDQSQVVQQHMQSTLIDLVATGLSTLTDTHVEIAKPEQLKLMQAKNIIHDHLTDFQLDRNFVAAAMGMSTRNLARIFKSSDLSITGYIRQCRLEAIATDLANPSLAEQSISTIACACGITNFQHFSKMFKDKFGASPSDYRNSNRV